MSQTKMIANLFNPHMQGEEDLINNFVIRLKEFQGIFNDIKSSTMEHPEQHYIIQGQRGSGKTTLLLRIYYEIKNNNKLNKWLIPLRFNEEQFHIRTLCRLWESVIELLEHREEFEGLYDKVEELQGRDDYDEICFDILSQALKKKKKKVVLFIDNIGDMLNKFNEQEHHRIREILLTSPDVRIIGASSVTLEHTYDYARPFFDFFKFVYMNELSSEETRGLLLKLSERYHGDTVREILEKQPERIETLRRLTGGIPRTIVLLFEIFADDKSGDSIKDLEIVLDRVTPLYKHRMEDLSHQQQEIVDVIAMSWDAISTKEIAEKIRMESKAVSAQLKQLEKNRIIHKIETSTKNYLYQITERFFNVWYLMRYGRRKERNRVLWLIRFLMEWCSKEELIERTKRHVDALSKGKFHAKSALYLTEALASTNLPMKLQHEVIKTTREFLSKKDKRLLKELSPSDIELHAKANKYFEEGNYNRWYKKLTQIKNKGLVNHIFGLVYHYGVEDYTKAEGYYLKAIDKGQINALYDLAFLYFEHKKEKYKALEYIQNIYDNKEDLITKINLVQILIWNNKIDEAIKYLKEILSDINNVDEPGVDIKLSLLLLIAKKQYHLTLKLFEEKAYNLKERYKPIYYALMYFMQDEYPNEYKKMGGELKETVEEIIARINQLGVGYK